MFTNFYPMNSLQENTCLTVKHKQLKIIKLYNYGN